jgi:aryl-alcohol dehydrogenase-like predicted oxidoreductase
MMASMETRKLGSLDVSVVGLGCNNFGGRMDAAALSEAATRHNMGILPYFPLASGMLTGKYRRGEAPPAGTRLAALPEERRERALSDKQFDRVEKLADFAAGKNRTLLELAMSWLAGLPAMASVIAGATKPEQVRANAEAVDWLLTATERDAVAALTRRS